MPRILVDPRLENMVWEMAINMVNLLKLPSGSTEVFPGPAGMIVVCLHKKPERTSEILGQIKSAFEEVAEKAKINVKVEVVDSDETHWHKI